ncbi:NAD(P)-dependent oxidoreductase [Nocardia sp. NPDC051570]|uniref:NAD(P)-dependent oxidoreductase n=1 Tax=Nocardia sp. NPDC051570 TaxID=3364324 RepID=UPI00378F4093
MTNQHISPISIIGLGPMGTALAETLLAHNHSVTVWNRTPGRADALVEKGARPAESSAVAIAASPISIVCLSDYDAVWQVLEPAGAAVSGRALVNLTSGTPNEARAVQDWVTARGAGYLDGAIMVRRRWSAIRNRCSFTAVRVRSSMPTG